MAATATTDTAQPLLGEPRGLLIVAPFWLGLFLVLPYAALVAATAVALVAVWVIARPLRGVIGGLATGALVAGLARANVAHAPTGTRVAGLVALAVCLSPFVLRPLRRVDGFPFLHLFGMVAAIYVATGLLLSRQPALFAASTQGSNRTVGYWLFALFMACVVVGALVVRPRLHEVTILSAVSEGMQRKAVWLILASFVGSQAVARLGLRGGLGGFATVVDDLRVAGLLILWLAYLRGGVRRGYLFVAVGAVGFDVLNGLGTTLLYASVAVPLCALAVYLHERRRVPWGVVSLVIGASLLLGAVKLDFRFNPQPKRSQVATAAALARQAISPKALSSSGLSTSATRFTYSTADYLGYVWRVIPRQFPWWDAPTYRYLVVAPLPRVLVPFKPTASFANTFGRRYGMLNSGDITTSPNMPVAVEGFVNFGRAGVVAAGLLFGLLVGYLGRRMRTNSATAVVYCALVARQVLIAIESDSTFVVGGLFITLVAFYPVMRWLSAEETRSVDVQGVSRPARP